jgi:hypothetical protein
MFEQLKRHKRILVTGPQRSGTKIAARMIAADTGYEYIDENVFSFNEDKFAEIVLAESIVVQCPTMSGVIEYYAEDDTLIVFMFRDLDDIAKSEDRMGWTVGVYQELYKFGMSVTQARMYRQDGGRTAPLKYKLWIGQKTVIKHSLELEYESLSAHPLWIPKDQRNY